ncbi:MAG: IS200/IS605 family transposase [Armatimonadota bacterium]
MPVKRNQPAGSPARQTAGSPYELVHTSGSSAYRLYCLATFYTRARQPLLDEEIIPHFLQALREVCQQYEYQLIAYYLKPNQVNLLLGYKPTVALTDLVGNIKRGTAHRLFEALPRLERRIGKRSFWAEGYYVETVGYRQVEGLVRLWQEREKRSKALLAAQAEAFDPLSINGKTLESALAELLPAERALIKLLHGLHGERVHTHEEVAEMLALKVEEVQQIEKEVLQKLRELLTGVRLTRQEGESG